MRVVDAPSGVRVDLSVAHLKIAVDAAPPWDAALADLLSSFTAGASGPAAFTLALALASGPPPEPGRGNPCFIPDPGRDGAWSDQSQSWDARLDASGKGAAGAFQLRLRRTEPHVRRELVAAALRVALATVAPWSGALLVHGASLATPAGALVFLGPSGEGKSSMVRRLPGWTLLADDASLLTPDAVSGTPLRGKEGLPRSGQAHALRGLVFLEKGAPAAELARLSRAAASDQLLRRVFWYARDPALGALLLEVVAAVAERVPCWRLASSLEHDVAPLLEAAVTGEVA